MRGDRSMKLQLTLIMHMKAKSQMLRHPCFAFVQVARGTLSDLIAKRKPRVHPSAVKAVAEVDEIKNGDAINAGLIFKGSQNSISSDSSSISKAKALAATVAKLWERLLGLAPGSVDLEVQPPISSLS